MACREPDDLHLERAADGRVERCETRDLRAGDMFCLVGRNYVGRIRIATGNAFQQASTRDPARLAWHVPCRDATEEEIAARGWPPEWVPF